MGSCCTKKIPVDEYSRLTDQFTAENFDAGFITDLALEAGMKYITFTTKHHDGFCLWDSQFTDYTSMKSAAGRDLVGELSQACRDKGLGLFLYYSYAADWKHPYFYDRTDLSTSARPDYPFEEPSYLWEKDEDFQIYIDYVHNQLRELLSNYGPIAGIWFDPMMGYYARPDLYPIEETYALIRTLQPQCLISFKQGASGDEDFVAPERSVQSLVDKVRQRIGKPESIALAENMWELNKNKPREICDTLQPKAIPGNSWGYNKAAEGIHIDADGVMRMVQNAADQNANLLLNVGPLPDGSIHPDDVRTLKEVGRRLESKAMLRNEIISNSHHLAYHFAAFTGRSVAVLWRG